MSLMKSLLDEIERNRKLLDGYKKIPNGFIGASMIQIDLDRAKKSIETDNVVEMLVVYDKLKNNA